MCQTSLLISGVTVPVPYNTRARAHTAARAHTHTRTAFAWTHTHRDSHLHIPPLTHARARTAVLVPQRARKERAVLSGQSVALMFQGASWRQLSHPSPAVIVSICFVRSWCIR